MCIARGEACYIAYRVGYEPYPKRRGPAEPHKFEGPRTYPGHTVWQTATTFYMIKLEMTQVDLNSNIDIITYAPYYTASLVHWVCRPTHLTLHYWNTILLYLPYVYPLNFSVFQDNLSKPLRECQTILHMGFATRGDGGGDVVNGNWNVQCSSQIITINISTLGYFSFYQWDALSVAQPF